MVTVKTQNGGDPVSHIAGEIHPVEQVRVAYSDAGLQRQSDEYRHADRDLDFCASRWFIQGSDDLAVAIGSIQSYNRFEKEKVIEKLAEAAEAHDVPLETDADPLRVAVGREGSPVLYIECDRPEKIVRELGGYADECWEVDYVGNAQKYIRNGDTESDVLEYSARDEFLVRPQNFPTPSEGRSVVRAWWD